MVWRSTMVWLLRKIYRTKRWRLHNDYSSSRLFIPRGSMVLALWMRYASRASLRQSRSYLCVSTGISNTWEKGLAIAEIVFWNYGLDVTAGGLKYRASMFIKTPCCRSFFYFNSIYKLGYWLDKRVRRGATTSDCKIQIGIKPNMLNRKFCSLLIGGIITLSRK